MLALTPDSAAQLLNWSNCLYVTGALLTLASAGMVLYEKRSKARGLERRWGFTTEIVVIIAAFISFVGTVGAIGFGNTLSKLKDADLVAYKASADVKISQADAEAKTALATTTQTANDNLTLRTQLQQLSIGLTQHVHAEQEIQKENHRTIENPIEVSASLRQFSDVGTMIEVAAGAEDAGNLQRQLLDIFLAVGIKTYTGTDVGPGRLNPVVIPGIHIHATANPGAIAFQKMLANILKKNGMTVDVEPNDEGDTIPGLTTGGSAQAIQAGHPFVWIYIGPAH